MSEHCEILYFEDPIGVTPGYRKLFDSLSKGLAQPVSLYRVFKKEELLVHRGNRKAPGYNTNSRVLDSVVAKYGELVQRYTPRIVVLTDPALLFLCVLDRDADWAWATIDNLRGGIYKRMGTTIAVTYPLTAWYQDVRERDIAAANDGFASKEEYEEAVTDQDEGEDSDIEEVDLVEVDDERDSSHSDGTIFYEPIQTKVAVGKFCLQSDWEKIHRILETLK